MTKTPAITECFGPERKRNPIHISAILSHYEWEMGEDDGKRRF
jgi:hypothetical protein